MPAAGEMNPSILNWGSLWLTAASTTVEYTRDIYLVNQECVCKGRGADSLSMRPGKFQTEKSGVFPTPMTQNTVV